MAFYLAQATYTPEAWAALLQAPQDRFQVLGHLLERLGGRLVSGYFAFGEYDVVAIMELPDNVGAAAVSLALQAGGAVKAAKTTPLMTVEEGLQAMRKAAGASGGYQPPTA